MNIYLFPEAPDMILRLIIASALGALIGLERDVHGRAAGLRTHLLVSLGAAVFTIMSEYYATGAAAGAAGRADPGRIAAQVVTGIGFLGAGAIIKEGINVRGLTTAACLWLAAAIGLASGAACYLTALSAALLGLCALVILKHLEIAYPSDFYRTLTVATGKDADLSRIADAITRPRLTILSCEFDRNYEAGTTTAEFAIRISHKRNADELSADVVKDIEATGLPIKSIKWGRQH